MVNSLLWWSGGEADAGVVRRIMIDGCYTGHLTECPSVWHAWDGYVVVRCDSDSYQLLGVSHIFPPFLSLFTIITHTHTELGGPLHLFHKADGMGVTNWVQGGKGRIPLLLACLLAFVFLSLSFMSLLEAVHRQSKFLIIPYRGAPVRKMMPGNMLGG